MRPNKIRYRIYHRPLFWWLFQLLALGTNFAIIAWGLRWFSWVLVGVTVACFFLIGFEIRRESSDDPR